jgi:hypothetical protein
MERACGIEPLITDFCLEFLCKLQIPPIGSLFIESFEPRNDRLVEARIKLEEGCLSQCGYYSM